MKLIELAFFCDDVPATSACYQALLGVEPRSAGPGVAVFERDGLEVLVHARYTPGPDDLPCEDHAAYACDDLDASYARLLEAGFTPVAPPRRHDWGRSAYLRDPDGRLIELSGGGGDDA